MQQLSPSDLKADQDLPSAVKVLSTSSSQKKRARRLGNHRRGESFSKQGMNDSLLQGKSAAKKKVKRNQSIALANGIGFRGGRATVEPPGVMSERNDAGLRKGGAGELSKRGIAIAAAVKLETSLNQDLE